MKEAARCVWNGVIKGPSGLVHSLCVALAYHAWHSISTASPPCLRMHPLGPPDVLLGKMRGVSRALRVTTGGITSRSPSSSSSSWHLRRLTSSRNSEELGAPESSRFKLYGQKAGVLFLLAATGAIAASTVDDILVYHQCSSKAMEKVAEDERLKKLLGDTIKREGWYKATIGFAHERCSVSCSFPVSGSQGTAKLRLRAVRPKETENWRNIFSPGSWNLLVLEAYVPVVDGGAYRLQHINLMETNDTHQTQDGNFSS